MDWLQDIVRDLLLNDLVNIIDAHAEDSSPAEDRISRILAEWQNKSPSVQSLMDTAASLAEAAELIGTRVSDYHTKSMLKRDQQVHHDRPNYTSLSNALSDYKISRDDLAIERVAASSWTKYGSVGRPYPVTPHRIPQTHKLDLLKLELRRALARAEEEKHPSADALKAAVQRVIATNAANMMPKRLGVKKPPPAVACSGSEETRIEAMLSIGKKLPLRDQTALLAVLGTALNSGN